MTTLQVQEYNDPIQVQSPANVAKGDKPTYHNSVIIDLWSHIVDQPWKTSKCLWPQKKKINSFIMEINLHDSTRTEALKTPIYNTRTSAIYNI